MMPFRQALRTLRPAPLVLGLTLAIVAAAQLASAGGGVPATPNPQDEFFEPRLEAGVFTVCKVAPGSETVFPFDVEVDLSEGGTTLERFDLFDASTNLNECVDVHTDTPDGRSDTDLVTISELVPPGYNVSRVGIWNLDDGQTTFEELPAGTETISGEIDASKQGCVAIFYNDFDKGACWMTGGGVKFERLVGDHLATCSMGKGPQDTVGGVVFPACSADPSEGGQWNHVAHSAKIHIKGNDVQVVNCGNVDGIEPGSESPVTPFNFIEFEGTGEVSGIHGNKLAKTPIVFFGRVEDRNEPGNEQSAKSGEDIDRYFLRVEDLAGNLIYLVDEDQDPSTVDPVTITGGNFQIHTSSCN